MSTIKKWMAAVLLFGIPTSLYIVSLYSYEEFCARERLSKHCNLDEDCCAGKECDAFGFCIRKR